MPALGSSDLASADADFGGGSKLRKRRGGSMASGAGAARAALRPIDTNNADHGSHAASAASVKGRHTKGTDSGMITPTNDQINPAGVEECSSHTSDIDTSAVTQSAVKSTSKKRVTKKQRLSRGGGHGHDHSFFSPPRITREPIPFLSPKAPVWQDFAGMEDVRLLRNPRLTFRYFLQGVNQCARNNLRWPSALTTPVVLTLLTGLTLVGLLLRLTLDGALDSYYVDADVDASISSMLPSQYAAWLVSASLEAGFWFGCGVLSTAGLGSGVQTGALILFPHCCKLALEWADSQQKNVALDGFADLMWMVAVPGFWSGSGSAVGELLPFVLARMIKAAGGDPFALLEEPDVPDPRSLDFDECAGDDDKGGGITKKKKKSWTSVLVANTRNSMERQMLSSRAWLKIFILAAVPNGLFDLCGLVCGSAGVPFWTFFSAVWSGKAIVRTPLQTCGLTAAVGLFSSGTFDEDNMDTTNASSIRTALLRMVRDAVSAMVRGDDAAAQGVKESASTSTTVLVGIVKVAWSGITFGLLGFFLLSTIEQVAQHHAKTLREKRRAR